MKVWPTAYMSDLVMTAPQIITRGKTPVDVVALGADPTGVNDSTGAIIRAVAQAQAGIGVVTFPDGLFRHTGFRLSSGVHLVGAGSGRLGQGGRTILQKVGGGIGIQGDDKPVFSAGLRGIGIRGTDEGGIGMLLDSFQYFYLEDVSFDRFRDAGDTGIGVKMINTHGVCAYNRFFGLTIENSDTALILDSTNGAHATGYNYFAGLVIYQEQDCIQLLRGVGNGSIRNVFNGVYIQSSAGATGDYIYVEGNGNLLAGVEIDAPQSGNILEFALSDTQGNSVEFLSTIDPAKYVNNQTSGAANRVIWPGYFSYSPGKQFQVNDPVGALEASWQSEGDNAVEHHFGNATAGSQAWRTVLQGGTATPSYSINRAGVGPVQRWNSNLIEMLFNLQLHNNLLMPNGSGVYFDSSTAVQELVLGLSAGNIVQLVSPTQGGGIQLICRHASGVIEIAPGGSVEGAQFDGSAAAGTTRMLLYDQDAGALKRVKVGANGTGPGGSGRALYVDNP